VSKFWGTCQFIFTAVGSLLAGFVLLVKRLRKELRLIRYQLRYIFLGTFLMFLGVLIFNFILVVFFKISTFVNLGPFFVLPFIFFTTYAIVRHRLMDIKFIIRRGFVHIASFVIIIAIYTYLILLIQDYFEISKISTILFAVFIITLSVFPFRKWLFGAIDNLFYQKEIEKEKRINDLISKLPSVAEYDQILKEINSLITQNLKCGDVRILIINREDAFEIAFPNDAKKMILSENNVLVKYLSSEKIVVVKEEIPFILEQADEEEKPKLKDLQTDLKSLKAEVAVALRNDIRQLMAVILIGPKESKDVYTVQDINLFKKLAEEASIGLANVLLYKHTIEGLKRRIEKGEIGV